VRGGNQPCLSIRTSSKSTIALDWRAWQVSRAGGITRAAKAADNGKWQVQSEDRSGSSVASPVLSDSAFYALHSDPNRTAELGRKGGAHNRIASAP
jgi:hypothetical protein